ncbi:hypothetical protein MKW94_000831 [Papaver nudicaule]|uniref:UDENN domain-containing protein n=2 Tax=Papaver nudicaule TaxID=74823 RepID=A0AA41VEL2_PAPNU|nr:hypothetical protein [Papaver nudicaule]
MSKNEEGSSSPGWSAAFFMQTTEEVARAVVAAATGANNPARPSVVFSSKDENNSQLQKLQRQVTKVLKGWSPPVEVKRVTYNPEVLTSLKRQWARFQSLSLDHRSIKEPTKLFESMVVVGLHPNTDVQTLQNMILARKSEGSGKLRSALGCNHSARVEPNLEPQVLFVYPPEKQLPLKYKDLVSFCFPGGLEVHAVERTPSMSELSEILLGQEHFKQSDLSFVFRLQVADDSTLYGCCMLVEEIVQKPSGLISMISEKQPPRSSTGRQILTTKRCYCILTRLPFFDLHFGILNSMFTQERLEWLTKGFSVLDLDSPEVYNKETDSPEKCDSIFSKHDCEESLVNEPITSSEISTEGSTPRSDDESQVGEFGTPRQENGSNVVLSNNSESEQHTPQSESRDAQNIGIDELSVKKLPSEKRLPEAVLPMLRYHQYESSESSSSFQGSPCDERTFRGCADEADIEEASSSGQEDSSDYSDVLEWAKANNHGSLQIICEYHRLRCPARGTTLLFRPLDHLHPLEFHRPGGSVFNIAGSTIDLRSCNTSLEVAEAQTARSSEEEATALSIWAVACICGSLRLDHVLTMFAAALLEKQIVVVCSNLGVLSALVLSIIPLIQPFRWQSLLMPVLPNDMLDFLDAPVPYIVGVKNKTSEVVTRLANGILVDANKNQVQSPTMPQLPKQKELISSLSPYHAKLVGESYLAKRRPIYECTEVQTEAAKGFLAVLRSYMDSLCSNLRSHTITNVQSNDDKVSLLLKESFIESFPRRDKPFMKLFVDTQLFSVHTDLVLSFYQKD